jgi:hypothetical protein
MKCAQARRVAILVNAGLFWHSVTLIGSPLAVLRLYAI